jgi:branched-chain amino acid transport system ATP-binding protein
MPEAALKTPTPAAATGALLTVRGLEGWYGESHVLHGIDIDVRTGEVITLLGDHRHPGQARGLDRL